LVTILSGLRTGVIIMETDEISTAGLTQKIGAIVGRVQRAFRDETGETYDDRLVEDGMRAFVADRLERLEEGLLEIFTSPERPEFHELAALIRERQPLSDAAVEVEELVHVAQEYGDESVFEGFRPFSKPKMAAMMEYLTGKGHYVYKTNLNKLLFYTDLSYFYLRGTGMSGAVYYNRPYGPVADPAELVLNELISNGHVNVVPRTKSLEAAEGIEGGNLSDDEKKMLDWVADTYGEMSATDISNLSHREMAYKYTEPNEPIAYAYGKFLKHLPPRDLLDR
jgi:uncharacterized phage-associated protein